MCIPLGGDLDAGILGMLVMHCGIGRAFDAGKMRGL